jgi:hypothetical protein
MPLPHSGAGETLLGGPSGSAGGARGSAALRHETLFGISPEQMAGTVTPQPSPASPPAQPALSPAQAFFGGPDPTAPGEQATGEGAAGRGTLTAGGVPLHGDSPVPHRTLVGVMPEEMVQALSAARERAPSREKPPPAAARPGNTAAIHGPPPPPNPAPPAGFDGLRGGGTMVGTAAAAPRAPAAPAPRAPTTAAPRVPATPAPRAPAARPAPLASAPPVGDLGTVRSMPNEPARPTPAARRGLATMVEPPPDFASEAEAAAQLPKHARTSLGVAIPGIAPLHAGMGNSPPAPRTQPPLEATRVQEDSFMGAAPLSARGSIPRGAFVLLSAGLALLLAAGAFALLWRAAKPLSVAISADASGKDRIDLVCEECPDGTLVTLNESRAEVSGRKAYLTLAEPLPLGESRVHFGLQRPGASEPEDVELTLPPVDYRIRPDTSTLGGDQPRLTLKVTAIPGSKVEIAQQLVAIDAQGNGEIAVDLSGQLIGPASEVTTFEQSIAYAITPPSGKVYAGELAFKIGVTPLLLEAPGIDTVTDLERFMLAGRTTKGAELWVAGTTIAVDGNGRFAQLMSIDSVGETRVTVRATEPGLAPRFASFRLQRVENLEHEVADRRRKAVPLADVTRSVADHIGSTVVVSGRVEEARLDGHRSLIILQAEGDCGGRSCLVRLVYGGLRKLSRGENITAIGLLQGTVGAPHAGGEVPEVDVSLLL